MRTHQRPRSRGRLRMVASIATALLAATGHSAYARDFGDASDRYRDMGVEIRPRFLLPGGRAFEPRSVLILTDDAALVGTLPRYVDAVPDNRLDLSGLGALSSLFNKAPYSSYLRPENRIGVVRRSGDVIVADLRGGGYGARDVEGRPLAFLTTPPRGRPVLALAMRPGYSEIARREARAHAAGPEIAHVYAAGRGVLLSPPYRRFYGARLF